MSTENTWVDEELEQSLERDASLTRDDPSLTRDPELAWGTLSDALDEPGPREPLVSLSTRTRRALALLGLLLFGGVLVGAQGVRTDLDPTGWLSFIVAGWTLAVGGAAGTLFALRSRTAPPVVAWPWIPSAWLFLLVWSAIGPWPGMTGVPPEMHFVCFSATSTMVLLSTVWIGLLEQGTRPVPWRLGLTAAGAGCVAFMFQSIFCPGIDYVHLVVGHGGASIVGGLLALAVAWAIDGVRSRG